MRTNGCRQLLEKNLNMFVCFGMKKVQTFNFEGHFNFNYWSGIVKKKKQ